MHALVENARRVQVGRLWFSPGTGQLEDEAGDAVHLRPQAALVLGVLVASSRKLVSKNTLIAEVWPHVSVTDDSLTQCIAEIRRAIGDHDRSIVKTYPKRGYMVLAAPPETGGPDRQFRLDRIVTASGLVRKFVIQIERSGGTEDLGRLVLPRLAEAGIAPLSADGARIRACLDSAPEAIRLALGIMQAAGRDGMAPRIVMDRADLSGPAPVKLEASTLGRLNALAARAGAGEILATVEIRDAALDHGDCLFTDRGEISAGSRHLHVHAIGPPAPNLRIMPRIAAEDLAPTIAIIPPTAPRARDDTTLGDIFADDLTAFLSRSQDFNVTSRLSTAALRDRTPTLREIKTALNADFVLSGSITTRGDRVVLTLELADTRGACVVWGDRLEVSQASIVEDVETVTRVAGHIRKAIVMRGVREVRKQSLGDVQAHSLLFGAVGLMHRLTLRDFMTARRLLEVLIERAPDQPAPHAWMARWHVLRVQQGWTDDTAAEARAALDFARRALDIDPENTLALTSEGIVLTNLMRQLDEARTCYDLALDSNPNDANARLLRGMLFGFQGKGSEAVRDTERALHLAPLDPHQFFFLALAAGASIAAGDHRRALDLTLQSERMNRSHTSTLRMKIVALMKLGREAEARQTVRDLLALQPGLRVGAWLRSSPSADYDIGTQIAATLRAAGIPE